MTIKNRLRKWLGIDKAEADIKDLNMSLSDIAAGIDISLITIENKLGLYQDEKPKKKAAKKAVKK